ncbi:MAG: MFS transporter [Desulfobacteraceae bacterium]|jgi:predicted MFS family arabinose efflux permease
MDKNKLIYILGFAGFIVVADNWVVSPILPAIAGDLNQKITKVGLLITAYMLPFGLFQLVFGPLADRYGKKIVISIAMFLFTISTGLCAVAANFIDLIIYRMLTGVFAASVIPISLALIGDVVPLSKRQAAIGTFMGISFLGQGLSMAIGGTMAYLLNWRWVFGIYSILAALSTALLIIYERSYKSLKNSNDSFFKPYIRLLQNSVSIRLYLIVFLEGVLIIGSFSYIGAYISKIYQYNYFNIGLIMTAFGVAAVIGGRTSGKLAAKHGQKFLITCGLTIAALSDMFLGLKGDNLYILVIATLLLGFGFMLAHSILLTIATELASQARGAAMSLISFCFMGGGGIGTAIGGKIIDISGFNAFYLYGGHALLGLTLLVFVWIKNQFQRKHIDEISGKTSI